MKQKIEKNKLTIKHGVNYDEQIYFYRVFSILIINLLLEL